MTFSEGGNHFAEDPSELAVEAQIDEKQVVIRETYDGSEDPIFFLEHLAQKAAKKGVPLKVEDILRQSDKQAKEKKTDQFSFDDMEISLAKSIIFPDLKISLKAPNIQEKSKEKKKESAEKDKKGALRKEPVEIEYEDDDDDDNEDEERPQKKEKKEEEPLLKEGVADTDISKVRKILSSDNGRKMDKCLEDIKQQGKLLIAELTNCVDQESEKAVSLRLLLFEHLENAEILGSQLTQAIKDNFNIALQRDLAPVLIIKSYLKRRYKKQGIPLPQDLVGAEIIEGKESLAVAVDDRPQ